MCGLTPRDQRYRRAILIGYISSAFCHVDDQFTGDMAGLQIEDGLGSFTEGIAPLDEWLDLTGGEHLAKGFEVLLKLNLAMPIMPIF